MYVGLEIKVIFRKHWGYWYKYSSIFFSYLGLNKVCFSFLFFWLCCPAGRISVFQLRIKPRTCQWKHGILATRLPGNYQECLYYTKEAHRHKENDWKTCLHTETELHTHIHEYTENLTETYCITYFLMAETTKVEF